MTHSYSALLPYSYPYRPHVYSSICNLLIFSKCWTGHHVEHKNMPRRFPYKEEFVAPAAGSAVSGQPSPSATSWVALAAESHFAQGHAQGWGEWCTSNDGGIWRLSLLSPTQHNLCKWVGHLCLSFPIGLAETIWDLYYSVISLPSCFFVLPQVFVPRALPNKHPAHSILS